MAEKKTSTYNADAKEVPLSQIDDAGPFSPTTTFEEMNQNVTSDSKKDESSSTLGKTTKANVENDGQDTVTSTDDLDKQHKLEANSAQESSKNVRKYSVPDVDFSLMCDDLEVTMPPGLSSPVRRDDHHNHTVINTPTRPEGRSDKDGLIFREPTPQINMDHVDGYPKKNAYPPSMSNIWQFGSVSGFTGNSVPGRSVASGYPNGVDPNCNLPSQLPNFSSFISRLSHEPMIEMVNSSRTPLWNSSNRTYSQMNPVQLPSLYGYHQTQNYPFVPPIHNISYNGNPKDVSFYDEQIMHGDRMGSVNNQNSRTPQLGQYGVPHAPWSYGSQEVNPDATQRTHTGFCYSSGVVYQGVNDNQSNAYAETRESQMFSVGERVTPASIRHDINGNQKNRRTSTCSRNPVLVPAQTQFSESYYSNHDASSILPKGYGTVPSELHSNHPSSEMTALKSKGLTHVNEAERSQINNRKMNVEASSHQLDKHFKQIPNTLTSAKPARRQAAPKIYVYGAHPSSHLQLFGEPQVLLPSTHMPILFGNYPPVPAFWNKRIEQTAMSASSQGSLAHVTDTIAKQNHTNIYDNTNSKLSSDVSVSSSITHSCNSAPVYSVSPSARADLAEQGKKTVAGLVHNRDGRADCNGNVCDTGISCEGGSQNDTLPPQPAHPRSQEPQNQDVCNSICTIGFASQKHTNSSGRTTPRPLEVSSHCSSAPFSESCKPVATTAQYQHYHNISHANIVNPLCMNLGLPQVTQGLCNVVASADQTPRCASQPSSFQKPVIPAQPPHPPQPPLTPSWSSDSVSQCKPPTSYGSLLKFSPKHYELEELKIGSFKITFQNMERPAKLKVMFKRGKLLYEFPFRGLPSSLGMPLSTQPYILVEIPFQSIAYMSKGACWLQLELKTSPFMFLGCLPTKTVKGRSLPASFDRTRLVDITSGQLGKSPYHTIKLKYPKTDEVFKMLCKYERKLCECVVPVIHEDVSKSITQTKSAKHPQRPLDLSVSQALTTDWIEAKRTADEHYVIPVHCKCMSGCCTSRCRCIVNRNACRDKCRCHNCKNPLSIMLKQGLKYEDAIQDKCLMNSAFQIKNAERYLCQEVWFRCCNLVLRLDKCVPGVVSCPGRPNGCDRLYQYSWCKGIMNDVTDLAIKHCVQCHSCVDSSSVHCEHCQKCYLPQPGLFGCPVCSLISHNSHGTRLKRRSEGAVPCTSTPKQTHNLYHEQNDTSEKNSCSDRSDTKQNSLQNSGITKVSCLHNTHANDSAVTHLNREQGSLIGQRNLSSTELLLTQHSNSSFQSMVSSSSVESMKQAQMNNAVPPLESLAPPPSITQGQLPVQSLKNSSINHPPPPVYSVTNGLQSHSPSLIEHSYAVLDGAPSLLPPVEHLPADSVPPTPSPVNSALSDDVSSHSVTSASPVTIGRGNTWFSGWDPLGLWPGCGSTNPLGSPLGASSPVETVDSASIKKIPISE